MIIVAARLEHEVEMKIVIGSHIPWGVSKDTTLAPLPALACMAGGYRCMRSGLTDGVGGGLRCKAH